MDRKIVPINKGQFTLEPEWRIESFEERRGFGVREEYRENRRLWKELPEQQMVSRFPIHVDIELASVCNLKCPMCYTITPEFGKKINAGLMDFELYKNLIDQCVIGGAYSVRLSFRGESFLHKKFIDCVRYAKQKGIKEVSTLTNGLKLDEEVFVELADAGLDWLTISFDGLGEIYEQIRKPAKFDRAVEKIRNYSEIKKEKGWVKPVIKVQSILPAIEEDPAEFYRIFAPIVDMVSANPLIDFMQSTSHLPKIAGFSCPQIYQRLVVGADGLCMMCTNDEHQKVVVGDANMQTLQEIWHGESLSNIRRIHAKGSGCEKIEPCAECYLPIETFEELVELDGRVVVADKYKSGLIKVKNLNTPDKYKRDGLSV